MEMSDLSSPGTTYAEDASWGTEGGNMLRIVVRFDAMVDPSASDMDIGAEGMVRCASSGFT
jgi:hypothetical protein